MIISSFLFPAEMNEMIVLKQAEFRPDQLVSQDRKDIMRKVCAGILIVTDLTGLSFQSNNGVVSMDYNPGRYMVFVSEGERVLEIYKEGFKPMEIILSQYGIYGLKSGQVYQLEVTSDIKESDSGEGNFTLDSNPQGADIIIKGLPDFKGKTPFEFKNYKASIYSISLKKDRYIVHEEKIKIEKNKSLKKMINLAPNWADGSITSNPTGLEVYLNKSLKGRTPLVLSGIDNGLSPGTYDLMLLNPNEFYKIKTDSLQIKAGDQIVKNYILEDISGTIQLAKAKERFTATLDNQFHQGLNDLQKVRLPQGRYTIRTQVKEEDAEFYLPWEETADLKAGDQLVFTPVHKSSFAELTVKSSESPYQVFLNNKLNNQLSLSKKTKLIPGEYLVRVEKTGVKKKAYESFNQNLTLNDKEEQEIFAELKAIKGYLLLNSSQDKAIYEIKDIETGKLIKVESDSEKQELLIGQYEVTVSRNGFLSQTKMVDVKANKTEHVSFQLNTYKGSLQEKKSFWTKNMYAGMAFTLISGAAIYYSGMKTDDYYTKYSQARTTPEAVSYHQQADTWNKRYQMASVGISLPSLYTVYSMIMRTHKSYLIKKG